MMTTDFIPNSFQVPNILVDEVISSVSPNALKCYLIIIRKTTGWGKEWDKISTTQIMELSGIKKKNTVYKATKELEELGLIESKKTKGRLTEYRLVPKKDTSTQKGYRVVPKKDTTSSTQKGYSTKDTKTKDTITKEEKDKKENLELPNWLDKNSWTKWVQFRKEIKKPLTPTTIQAHLKFLEKNRYEQKEIINQSINGSWQGLFEVKKTKQYKSLAQRNDEAIDKYLAAYSNEGVIDAELN